MARHRRPRYYCECAWNKCTVQTWKEPKYCLCEYQSRAVNWIMKKGPTGQLNLDEVVE